METGIFEDFSLKNILMNLGYLKEIRKFYQRSMEFCLLVFDEVWGFLRRVVIGNNVDKVNTSIQFVCDFVLDI